MATALVIHRDLKLKNIMVHFPDAEQNLNLMSPEDKIMLLHHIDLENTWFEIKIADFGFSK